MYPRQFRQFLRAAEPTFDENRFGSIADLMRACQKDGLLRLERDRQGGLRVFASMTMSAAAVPVGWSRGGGPVVEVQSEAEEGAPQPLAREETAPAPLAVVDAESIEPVEDPAEAPAGEQEDEPKPRRSRARRRTPAGEAKPRRPRKRD
jgi:hypothetical protein